jgi:hypothetical protein
MVSGKSRVSEEQRKGKGELFMKRTLIVNYILALCVLLLIATATTACARSIITLRIVDAESGQPIKEAVVAYRWYKYEFGVPGLPSKDVTVEAGEEISDPNGAVNLPKYLMAQFNMCVYKKGYVCWNNLNVFPGWKERKDFSLENGIVIRLEPLKQHYSKKEHARFTVFMSNRCPDSGHFGEAIEDEVKIYYAK